MNTGLQPGAITSQKSKPFERFSLKEKPLKRLASFFAFRTRLKPGVNETSRHVMSSENLDARSPFVLGDRHGERLPKCVTVPMPRGH